MPVANQYGIDLGNILSTVSDLKTAQQNQENNAIKNNMLSRKNDEEINSQNAFNEFKDDNSPDTPATNMSQLSEMTKYTQDQKAIKEANDLKTTSAIANQVTQILQMPEPERISTAQKILQSKTPDELKTILSRVPDGDKGDINDPNFVAHAIPFLANGAFTDAQNAQHSYDEHVAKTANENKMNQLNVVWGNKNAIADKNNDTKLDIADKNNDTKLTSVNINADSRKSIATYKASHPTANGKPSVLEMKASALVDNGDATDINDGIRQVMKSTTNTQINDPVMGNKTVTSKKTYGNGDSNAKKNGSVVYDKQGNPYRVINGTPVRIK